MDPRPTVAGSRAAAATVVRRQYRFLYSNLVKTTLDINDDLLARAKAASAKERKSLTALIEEGLRLRLRARKTDKARRIEPAIFDGTGGMRPGIDPLSNRSILDAVDEPDSSA